MSRIAGVFANKSRRALIAYVMAGYPSLSATLEAVPLLAASGCDIIELGIPFSDPLADGATIQQAAYGALENGVSVAACLDIAARLSERVKIPLVFMTYFNPVLSYGIERFCRDSASAGVDGLIVPDLPPDEGAALEGAAVKHGLDLIYLLAPNSSDERIRLVAEKSRGFIYLVSLTGTTGARQALPVDLEAFVSRVRKMTDKPLCVGFGISTPEQARRVAAVADGVIIGSRVIQLMEKDISLAGKFMREVREQLSC